MTWLQKPDDQFNNFRFLIVTCSFISQFVYISVRLFIRYIVNSTSSEIIDFSVANNL